jgi:ribosomal protein S14
MSPSAWLIAKCALIVILTALILVRFARACECEICGGEYAVYRRKYFDGTQLDLCRRHARLYDQAARLHRPGFIVDRKRAT